MASDLVCLKWNNHKSTFLQLLSTFRHKVSSVLIEVFIHISFLWPKILNLQLHSLVKTNLICIQYGFNSMYLSTFCKFEIEVMTLFYMSRVPKDMYCFFFTMKSERKRRVLSFLSGILYCCAKVLQKFS